MAPPIPAQYLQLMWHSVTVESAALAIVAPPLPGGLSYPMVPEVSVKYRLRVDGECWTVAVRAMAARA